MGIINSGAYALSPTAAVDAWKPVIGHHNVLTAAGVSATTAAAAYPVTNLVTPSTVEGWRGTTTAPHVVRGLFDPAECNYVAAVRPNFGSGLIPFSVEGLPPGGDPDEPSDWIELVEETQPASDRPFIRRFVATTLIGIQLVLTPGAVVPRIGGMKAGMLTLLPKGIPPGHQPIEFADEDESYGLESSGGDFLGAVVTRIRKATSLAIRDLDPDWYRANLAGLIAAQPDPFYFVPFPVEYPNEVAYCWLPRRAKPTISEKTGTMDINMSIVGVAS